ncbi:MAG: dTDP-4-dehydrorhamnose 3,5-epimerase [Simkaniaceae bacterium]|nr:dTDP-4-dehydrorhamnose 3,5-epimerase [Simkaniaceae bacterium]
MQTEELELKGVYLIKPKVFTDERGFFYESYQRERYRAFGVGVEFVQDNYSFSKQGTIRGMHFQTTPGQAKLVSVNHGAIYDVVVDIRKDSPTFKRWIGVYLDDANRHQLFVPVGFAHGFCVVSKEAHVQYKVSSLYAPETEKGFFYADREIGIEWPVEAKSLSERDLNSPRFCEVV